jgi:hypothetical protein
MGQVIVRQLDDTVIEEHRRTAKVRSLSLEQQLRESSGKSSGSGRSTIRCGSRRSS